MISKTHIDDGDADNDGADYDDDDDDDADDDTIEDDDNDDAMMVTMMMMMTHTYLLMQMPAWMPTWPSRLPP